MTGPGLVGLDACVFLAVLLPRPGGVAAAEVAAARYALTALEEGRVLGITSALALAEVDYALGRDGITVERRQQVRVYLTQVLRTQLAVEPVDAEIAFAAADHRLAHYHRERSPISYADSIYVATARRSGAAQLLTTDTALLALQDPTIAPPSALRTQ